MGTITISDWAIVLATVAGPVFAVLISMGIERRRARRAARQRILQTFLNTMHHPGDPGYQAAIREVAVEFRNDQAVMSAHREFLDAANLGPSGPVEMTAQKLVKLVALLFNRIGSKVSEDDVRGMGFVSVGFAERERLFNETLKAIVRVADTLEAQLNLLKGAQASQRG
jgi:hypothetical protein